MGLVYWARRRLRRLLDTNRASRPALSWQRDAEAAAADLGATLPANAPNSLLARNEHGLYCVPRAAIGPIPRWTAKGEVWEASTIDLIRDADPTGDIVHAGTFFGDFIPALARSRTGGALIWGFEPGSENYRCAEITTELNELDNVVLRHAGLGAESGTARLAITDTSGRPVAGASRVIRGPARSRWFENEQIQIVSIDEAIPDDRRIVVIHLDIEGYEQWALAGAMRTIERCRPLLVLETLPEEDWIEENLAPLGYVRQGTVDINSILRAPSPAIESRTQDASAGGVNA